MVVLFEKEDERRGLMTSRAPGTPRMAFWTWAAGGGRSKDLLLLRTGFWAEDSVLGLLGSLEKSRLELMVGLR